MSWAEAGDRAEMAVSRASVMALAYVMGWLRLGHDEDSNTAPRSKVLVGCCAAQLSSISPQNNLSCKRTFAFGTKADNPTAPAFVRYWSNSGHRPQCRPS